MPKENRGIVKFDSIPEAVNGNTRRIFGYEIFAK